MNRSLIFKAPDVIYLHQDIPWELRMEAIQESYLAAQRQLERVFKLNQINMNDFELYLDVVPVDNELAVLIYVSDRVSALVIGHRNVVMEMFERVQQEGGQYESLVDASFHILQNTDTHLYCGMVLN